MSIEKTDSLSKNKKEDVILYDNWSKLTQERIGFWKMKIFQAKISRQPYCRKQKKLLISDCILLKTTLQ